MGQIGEFLRAVIEEWRGWLTGSLPMAGLGVLSLAIPITIPLWAWAILVFVAGLVVAMFRVWKSERTARETAERKIKQFENKSQQPRLRCSFGMNVAGCVMTAPYVYTVNVPVSQFSSTAGPYIVHMPERRAIEATWFRTKVENMSDEPLRQCSGRMLSIIKATNGKVLFSDEVADLTFAPGGRSDSLSKEIRQGQHEYLDFLFIAADNKPRVSVMSPPTSFDWENMFSERGDYILEFIATCPTLPRPERMEILFRWHGERATAELFHMTDLPRGLPI